MKSRIPTKEEKIEIVEYILTHGLKSYQGERENIEGFVESASIAVFDHYITSSPGYSGKLMVVVFITVQLFSIKWSHKTEQAMIILRLINTQEVSYLTGKDLNHSVSYGEY
jgi:hypothetical protein